MFLTFSHLKYYRKFETIKEVNLCCRLYFFIPSRWFRGLVSGAWFLGVGGGWQFHCSPHEVNIERCLPSKAWKFAVTSILAAPSELTVSAALVRDGVPSAARQSRLSGSWREEAQSPFVSVVFLSLLQRAAIFGMCVSRGTWTFSLPIR